MSDSYGVNAEDRSESAAGLTAEKPHQEFKLKAYELLRFEISAPVSVKLMEGQAELFGTELIHRQRLPLSPGTRGTLCTFHGCHIGVYSSGGSGMLAFITSCEEDQQVPHIHMNIHHGLERMREEAVKEQRRGPRLLVCGQCSSGKSTLCRTLVNYAARRRRRPMLVDLNVGLSQVSIPGTLAAQMISRPYDLVEGWALQEDPLVMPFGHLEPGANMAVYECQLRTMAELVNIRAENDMHVLVAGCIINMNGYQRAERDQPDNDLTAIMLAIDAFEVDTVLVIEDGFLLSALQQNISSKDVRFIRLPKSSGVDTRSMEQWTRQRDARVTSYFHGEAYHMLLNTPSGGSTAANSSNGPYSSVPASLRTLQPQVVTWRNSRINVYKLGVEVIPDSLLPHGEKIDETSRTQPQPVKLGRDLVNRILAISQAADVDNLIHSIVYAFVVLLTVSEEKGVSTFLAPCDAQEPPSDYFLLTDLCYVDPDRAL